MFKEIPFSRIKSVSDYMLKKLNEGNVILGLHVCDNEVRYVKSLWIDKNKSYIHVYFQYPIMDNCHLGEEAFVNINSEDKDYCSIKEFKEMFDYDSSEFIRLADYGSKEYHVHWYYSDERNNAWGPLESKLVEMFMTAHPQYSILCDLPYEEMLERLDNIKRLGAGEELIKFFRENMIEIFAIDKNYKRYENFVRSIYGVDCWRTLTEIYVNKSDGYENLFDAKQVRENILG